MIEAEEASIAQSLHNMCLGAGLIWTKQLAKAAAAEGKVAAPNRVKISACTEPSRGRPGYTDVIVYPEVGYSATFVNSYTTELLCTRGR